MRRILGPTLADRVSIILLVVCAVALTTDFLHRELSSLLGLGEATTSTIRGRLNMATFVVAVGPLAFLFSGKYCYGIGNAYRKMWKNKKAGR